ncbi:MAG: NTP transferase domain-containing protein [Thermoproteales archaeon]|nr:NTP transferase domain-containing protein [Thermoproteales archaeon]
MAIREAVILAAGYGSRIRGAAGDTPKPLITVHGIPLIAYSLASLLNAGVKHFYIVVNPKSRTSITRFMDTVGIDAEVIVNEAPERGNGYSLILGMEHVKDVFFLSMSDHIYDPKIPGLLYSTREFDVIIGVDSNPRYISVDEATKVLVDRGVALDIGKKIPRYTHIDIGLFIMKRSLYEFYRDYAERNQVVELSSLIKHSISSGKRVAVADIGGLPWIDVDTVNDLRRAENEAHDLLGRAVETVRRHLTLQHLPTC